MVSHGMIRSQQRFKSKRRQREAGRAANPEEVAAAHDILVALEKVDKNAAIYPAGSPTIQGFADELFAKATALLAKTRIVDFSVGANEIEYEGEVVLDGAKQERSLAFTLEDGGVRRLVLLEGLERAEVGALVQSLAEARAKGAEDLVTLLWARDLRHVGFVAASVYADPDEEAALDGIDGETTREKLVDRVKGRAVSFDQIAMVRSGAQRAKDESTIHEGPEATDVFDLRPEDEQGLRRWIDAERDQSPAAKQADVLLLLLEGVPGEEALRARLPVVARAIEGLLEEGDPVPAAELLAAVRRGSETLPAGSRAPTAGGPLRTFFQSVASPANGERLARFLARSHDDDSVRAVRLFLLGCGKHALVLAGDLLGLGASDASIVAALAQACGDDLAEVRHHAADPVAKVAVASLRVLTEAVGESGLDDYRRALLHRDPRVRSEALFAISRCREPRALDPLVDAVHDADAEVRLMALRAIPTSLPAPRPDLYQRVLKLVTDDNAREARTRVEQDLLFAALVRLDPERGHAFIDETVHAYPFLNRERAQKRRIHAIAALGEVATTRAEAYLTGLETAAKTPEVRAACRAALERCGAVRRTVKIIARRPAPAPAPATVPAEVAPESGPAPEAPRASQKGPAVERRAP